MARGVNRVILIGNLGADPESRRIPSSGAQVTSIRIATSETWRDKQSGEQKERTEWHSIAFFGRLAEIAAEYLRKGSQVYVEGSLRTRKWQGNDGQDRYSTEVIASEMQMLGGKGEPRAQPSHSNAQAYASASRGGPAPAKPPEDNFGDDDIPF